jgi:hypothetical protein
MFGYSGRQLQRWWATYRKGSLEALLEIGTPGGKKERINEEALAALEREMKEGTLVALEEARRFSSARASAIHYEGVSGLCRLFEGRRTNLKTGRRRGNRASEEMLNRLLLL